MASPTILAGQTLTAALLSPPAWTAMSLLNSWANFGSSYANAQYRLWQLLNAVECIGTVTGGTTTDGTILATLANSPASNQQRAIAVTASSALNANNSPRILIDTSANLKIESIPGTSPALHFHFWYSLDA